MFEDIIGEKETKLEHPFRCPECGYLGTTVYDISQDGKSGRYSCSSCGRDSSWAQGTAESIWDLMKKMNVDIKYIGFKKYKPMPIKK